MASSKDKKYPPGQKPAAKPTMAEAFNAAQGSAVNRPYGPGNPKPTPSLFPKGNSSQGPKDTRGVAQRIVEAGKPKAMAPKESADVTAQKKAADTKINAARMAKDLAVGAKVVKKAAAAVTPAASTSTAKPYVKLKQPAREAARRAYVQKQLDRLGIKPAAGKPRSAEEKAARAKARATWDKKNPFKPKSGE
jgi:hypothetical protein